jgi:hypothetical protein
MVVGNNVFARKISGSNAYLVQLVDGAETVIATYVKTRAPLFTSVCSGPDGIYIVGVQGHSNSAYTDAANGATSTIYRMTFDDATAKYNPPSPITSFPDGEIVNVIKNYAGYILFGTNWGVRVGQFQAAGSLNYGPLIKTNEYINKSFRNKIFVRK